MKSKSKTTTKRQPDGIIETVESTHTQDGFLSDAISKDLADALTAPARIVTLVDGTPVALAPNGWKVESLAAHLPAKAPTFRNGNVFLDDQESLVAYVKRHRTDATVLYASRNEETGGGLITAMLDDGAPCAPGRRIDRATLKIEPDPRFAAWLAIVGKGLPQRTFMNFIEDHDREFVAPSGAQMRTHVNQLDVKKLVRFKSIEKEDSAAADVSLVYETDTQQINTVQFPQVFTISVPIMRFMPPVAIEGRIRFHLKDSELFFAVRLENVAVLIELAWDAILAALRTDLQDTPVLNGRP